MTSPDFVNMTQQEIVDHIVNSMMKLVREDLAKNSIKVLEKDEVSVKIEDLCYIFNQSVKQENYRNFGVEREIKDRYLKKGLIGEYLEERS